jgi:LssY C-terminus
MAFPILIALLLAASDTAVVPAGAELWARLTDKVASNASSPNAPVEAVLIAPVAVNGRIVLNAGTRLRGRVKQVRACSEAEPRALLELEFFELIGASGARLPASLRVEEVDNARETVDETGRINGILASETISGQLDRGIGALAQKYAGLADILQSAKKGVLSEADPEIVYEPGTELVLRLTQEIKLDAAAGQGPGVEGIEPESELVALVASQPFQTTAESPPKPSDITNLMFIGSQAVLEAVFEAAGWSPAADLSGKSKFETFRAIAESRGYKEAPMSILVLDGRKPALTFQKQNNTFAQRHHLRVWARPVTFQGKAVWVCAATHDIGIEFSPENQTFIHKIDSNIDRERAKVVSDLLFTGKVRGLALVERPDVPRQSVNATGDKLETDGRMAVLLLE